ncbi:unnamed protein product [Camellia sinensis]
MVLQRRETRIISDDGRFERAFSMKIWQLKIPNKVEIFAWKTCSYILPVRSNLIDNRCKKSQSAEEVARYVADYLQDIEGDSFNYGYDVCTTKGFVEHAVPALGECVTLRFKAIQFTNNSQPKNIGRKDVSG